MLLAHVLHEAGIRKMDLMVEQACSDSRLINVEESDALELEVTPVILGHRRS